MKRRNIETPKRRKCSPADRLMAVVATIFAVAAGSGCLYYGDRPGSTPADFGEVGLLRTDTTRGARFHIPPRQSARPAAALPTSLALARVQGESAYSSLHQGSIVRMQFVPADHPTTSSTTPSRSQLERLDALHLIDDAFTVDPMPAHQREDLLTSLRRASLDRGAGLLMLYTFQTWTEASDGVPPVDLATLGVLPDVVTEATTTAHAVLIDAKSGYIYARAEADEETWQLASHWTREQAREHALERAERRAFNRLIDAFDPAWAEILRRYDPSFGRPVVPNR